MKGGAGTYSEFSFYICIPNQRLSFMTDTYRQRYFLPAEWYEQSGVQLTWPHEDTDWCPYLDEITEVCLNLVRIVARHEKVLVAARDADKVRCLIESSTDEDVRGNIRVYQCENNDTWARDHSFITLVSERDGGEGSFRLLDFRFNGWGRKFPADKDNRINASLYDAGAFNGVRVDNDDFVLEGGSVESDGRGTIFTTSMCLLAPNRNQPMTREEIEQRLMSELCADRVVWLDHGSLTGDDTDGHIDTTVRTAPDDTLVYTGCDDSGDGQYEDFRKLEEQLRGLRTADGQPYRLLRLPMPDAVYYDGERLPATYANFLVINGAVIVPEYGQPEKDAEARRVIAEAFPGRETIGVNALAVVRQHGSLHCLTMQFPKGCMR